MEIAIQGDIGSFSYVMSTKLFGKEITIDSCISFTELFQKLKKNGNKIPKKGVIPIENALTGRIGDTVKLLIEEEKFNIIKEDFLEINHCLLTKEGIKLKDLKEIYGHPEAIAQCKIFLSKLNAKIISYTDGAAAIGHILEDNKSSALIASSVMNELYSKLIILEENIQDISWNQTRFLVIEYDTDIASYNANVKYKTSIILSTNHIPGALYKALSIFAKNNVNLTKLESIPSRKNLWEFNFIIDFEGHIQMPIIKETLQDLEDYTNILKVLGSYPLKNYKN